MKKNDNIFEGVWWAPNNDKKRYVGTLTLDNAFDLSLVDGEQDIRLLLNGRGINTNILVGQSLSTSITLLGCQNAGSQTSMPGIAHHFKVHAGTALIGDHFASEEDAKFDIIELRVSNLDEWTARSAIKRILSSNKGRLTKQQLIYEPPEVLSTNVPGGKLELSNYFKESPKTPSEIVWSTRETIRFTLKRRQSLDEINSKYVSPLRQLVTLASGVHISQTYLRVANSKRLDSQGYPIKSIVKYYTGRQQMPDPKTIRSAEMRFTLGTSKQNIAKIIPKWMKLSKKLGPDLDLLFSLNRLDQTYLWDSLFTVATASEGMHRRLYPGSPENTTFRNRLLALLTYASPIIGKFVGDKGKWATMVKDQRNAVAHSLTKAELSNEQVFRLMQTTQLLLHIVLLRKLGFTKKECANIVMMDSGWRFLSEVMPKTFPELFP